MGEIIDDIIIFFLILLYNFLILTRIISIIYIEKRIERLKNVHNVQRKYKGVKQKNK